MSAESRNKIMSLSSANIAGEAEDQPELPPGVEEVASHPILDRLLAMESEEMLERAKKFSRAKWKIQIWIKSGRTTTQPLAFTISFWESGKRLHGGGDESAFICRRQPNAPKPVKPPFLSVGRSPFPKEANPDGCDGIIPGDVAGGGNIVCPHCGVKWDTEHIADSLFYRVPVEVAATLITDWFIRLESNCDIYLKFRAEDIRTQMMARDFGIRAALKLKGMVIYPLLNIIGDTANGATLESRFKAMLLA